MLKSFSFATVALTFGILAAPVSAAPVSSLNGLETSTGPSATEQVHYRRHGRYHRRGHSHGYGPSINLSIGGGRHHHHHRHHRRHHHHY